MSRNPRKPSWVALCIVSTVLAACTGMGGKGMGPDTEMMKKEPTMEKMEKKEAMVQREAMLEKKAAMAARTGMLAGSGRHHASGKVTVVGSTQGAATLQLTDFTVDRVPDGRVYLAKNGDHARGVELGKLTQFSGAVTFSVPARVSPDDYDSVVIWCKRFEVEIGHAFFDESMAAPERGMRSK
ncbi:MAG: DM13 domain-containing protein [Nitrospirota bacterium]